MTSPIQNAVRFIALLLAPTFSFSATSADEAFFRLNSSNSIVFEDAGVVEGPRISASGQLIWREDQSIFSAITVGSGAGPYDVFVSGLPGGLTYDSGLRGIVGTTSAGAPPYRHAFQVTAKDGEAFATRAFELIVYPELRASVSESAAGTVGTPFSLPATVHGVVGTATWSLAPATGLPAGLSQNTASGTISGTPAAAGEYTGTMIVRDSIDGRTITSNSFSIGITSGGAGEAVATIGNGINLVIQNFFSAADWNNPEIIKKAVVSGTVGSNENTIAALRTGSQWAGILRIENSGNILGAGGTQPSKNGGTALKIEGTGAILANSGEIKAGGAAGGDGGVGGPGASTPGGVPGLGGRGEGYDGARVGGSAGTPGTGGSGHGGSGGSGGTWGAPSGRGTMGQPGTNGPGEPGTLGGEPGYAVEGLDGLTIETMGVILGIAKNAI